MLLWPAQKGGIDITIADGIPSAENVPGTIFQAPFAAVTDELLYDVNWIDVWKIFF